MGQNDYLEHLEMQSQSLLGGGALPAQPSPLSTDLTNKFRTKGVNNLFTPRRLCFNFDVTRSAALVCEGELLAFSSIQREPSPFTITKVFIYYANVCRNLAYGLLLKFLILQPLIQNTRKQ